MREGLFRPPLLRSLACARRTSDERLDSDQHARQAMARQSIARQSAACQARHFPKECPMKYTPLMRLATAALPLSASAGAALAHPGHDTSPQFGLIDGLLHMLTQPDHLLMLAGAIAVALAGVRVLRTRRASHRRRA
jgi:hypothetical protein